MKKRLRLMKRLSPTALFWWLGFMVSGWGWIGGAAAARVIADRIHPGTTSNKIYTTTSPMRVVWRWATTDMGYEQSCVSVWNDFPQPDPELQELAKGLQDMAGLAVDVAGGLVEAVLTMDEDKMAKLGGQFKDMFMLSIEVFQELWTDWKDADEYQKGYLTGKATSEVAGMFMPWAKVAKTLGKLSKADFLVQLGTKSKFFAPGGNGSGALGRAKGGPTNTFVNEVRTSTACFPAGTPVLTAKGLRPIESIRIGDMVMGRDEATGAQDWRAVVDTITTHPDTLYHLRIRVETHGERFTHRARDGVAGGAGDTDDADSHAESPLGLGAAGQTAVHVPGAGETIATTGNHPFYVLSRSQPGFVVADELEPGDRLSLADGGTAVVEAIRQESAKPGTRFRTYNLEVAEYHTYFVGQHAVWVHNFSRSFCDRFKSHLENLVGRIKAGKLPTGMDPADAAKSPHFASLHHARRKLANADNETWARAYTQGFLDGHGSGERGWLDYWEGRPSTSRGPTSAGHIKRDHVGKSDVDILASKKSNYPNQTTAEESIAEIVKQKQAEIEAWAKNAPAGSTNTASGVHLELDFGNPVGRGVSTSTNTVQSWTKAKIVLNSDGKGGWEMLTSYPIEQLTP